MSDPQHETEDIRHYAATPAASVVPLATPAASVVPLAAIVAKMRAYKYYGDAVVSMHAFADEIEAAVATAQAEEQQPVVWLYRLSPEAHQKYHGNPGGDLSWSLSMGPNNPLPGDFDRPQEWISKPLFASPVAQGWQPIREASTILADIIEYADPRKGELDTAVIRDMAQQVLALLPEPPAKTGDKP